MFRPSPLLLPIMLFAAEGAAAAASPVASPAREQQAAGTFEVKITPELDPANPVSRLTLDKQFHGALDATSRGQMLAFRTARPDSAAYVAIEQVTGSLQGRQGSFVLQHAGTMNRGAPASTVAVVPDSGTGALQGLSGTMTIEATGGVHHYRFNYHLPE